MATWCEEQHIGKDPDAGKDQGQEEKGTTEDECGDSITGSNGMSLSKLRNIVKDGEDWHAAVHGGHRVGHDLMTEQQQERLLKLLWHIFRD